MIRELWGNCKGLAVSQSQVPPTEKLNQALQAHADVIRGKQHGQQPWNAILDFCGDSSNSQAHMKPLSSPHRSSYLLCNYGVVLHLFVLGSAGSLAPV